MTHSTHEQVERNREILRLWDEEKTAGQIATVVGATRNAVIGVVRRAGKHRYLPVQHKTNPVRVQRRKVVTRVRPTFTLRKEERIEAVIPAPPVLVREPGEGVLLMELQATHCRNPIEEIEHGVFRFCGRYNDFKTYCPECRKLLYEPPRPKATKPHDLIRRRHA